MALCNTPCYSSALSEANTACVSQIPASEVVVQPAPFCVTIPGPILSAANAPAAVAQYSPCTSGYGGHSAWPYGGYGYGRRYLSGYSYPYYSRRALGCSTYDCNPCGPC